MGTLAEFAGLGRWGLPYCPASILSMAGEGVQNFSPAEKEPGGSDGDLSGLTDEQLMDRVAGHDDEDACTLLVHRSTGSVMARCYALTRNTATAHEITQETFMRIWRFRKTWTHTRSFAGWVREICGNRSIDAFNELVADAIGHIEDPKREQGQEPEERWGAIPEAPPPIPVEYRIAIAECMERLRPLDRGFLELKFWEDMSVAEIGRRLLNTSDPTAAENKIHTIKVRAYNALRKCLDSKAKTDVVFPESNSSGRLGAGTDAPEIAGADS